MVPAALLGYLLLIPFIAISLTVSAARLLFSVTGRVMVKLLRISIPENEKKRYEPLFTVIWVMVGVYAARQLENTNPLVLILTFLTFRNGANITRKFIYGLHDMALVKEHAGRSLMGRAVRLGILTEVLFLLIWAVSYRVITIGIRVLSGTGFSVFILCLWIAGALFGAVFGMLIARNNRGILLRDEILTVLLFSGKKGVEISERYLPEKFKRH